MRIAIEVKTIPASNTKPRRIVAYTANGQRLAMSYSTADDASNDTGSGEKAARYVAQSLADKMGWGSLGQGGGTKAGHVFCFPDKAQPQKASYTIREFNPVDGYFALIEKDGALIAKTFSHDGAKRIISALEQVQP